MGTLPWMKKVIFLIGSDTRAGYVITVWRPDLKQVINGKTILSKQPFFRLSRTADHLRNDTPSNRE
jgi:hypothetical protein